GDYIAGAFGAPSAPDGVLHIHSPADLDDHVSSHSFAQRQVAAAIDAAKTAEPGWRALALAERAVLLRRYQARLRAHAPAITATLCREIGKAAWDAAAEVQAMTAKVDLMLGEGLHWTQDRDLPALPGAVRYQPHGLMAVIGPFNFPGHLPNGLIVPALLLGNTVIFKPSDKAPGTATWIARAMHEAGLPPGVFQMVQGPAQVAEALVESSAVDGVLFVGSVAVGQRILSASAAFPGRLVALELGGKNAALLLPDCHVEAAVRELAFGAYASCGQRCTATSRVFVPRPLLSEVQARLVAAAGRLVVGHPQDPGVFMGPLVSAAAQTRLQEACQRAEAAGIEALVAGTALTVAGRRGHYQGPSVHLAPEVHHRVAGYTHDELFGPDLVLYPYDVLDDAVAAANATDYGLVASVFTADAARFAALSARLRVGVVHHNRSTAGASGQLPFGGIRKSGNHRPAGILAGQLCAFPQALLYPKPGAGLPSWPGLFATPEA
ncbi:MAG: aldehyde dehydrogenase family protein, partial [Polyangiales bacterium]